MKEYNEDALRLYKLKGSVDFSENDITRERVFIFVYRIFFKWLKENGVYKRYRANRIERYNANKLYPNKNIDIDDIVQNYPTSDIIDYSLNWSSTKEGRSYWRAKHKEWHSFIRNYLEEEFKSYDEFYDLAHSIEFISSITPSRG